MPGAELFLDLTTRSVVAHRGASGLRPENTLAAFRLARELGADGIELDVRLSRDGVVMVHHDPTLDRTTRLSGRLDARTASELREADAGGGEAVPTLAEALEVTAPLPVLIELKESRAAGPALEVVRRTGASGRVAFASFQARALAPLRGAGIALGAPRRTIALAALAAAAGWPPGRASCDFYAVPYRWKHVITVPSRRFIARALRQGRPVHVWTVDDPALAARLWRSGVQGILTNRPDLMLAERQRLADAPAGAPADGRTT